MITIRSGEKRRRKRKKLHEATGIIIRKGILRNNKFIGQNWRVEVHQ